MRIRSVRLAEPCRTSTCMVCVRSRVLCAHTTHTTEWPAQSAVKATVKRFAQFVVGRARASRCVLKIVSHLTLKVGWLRANIGTGLSLLLQRLCIL